MSDKTFNLVVFSCNKKEDTYEQEMVEVRGYPRH